MGGVWSCTVEHPPNDRFLVVLQVLVVLLLGCCARCSDMDMGTHRVGYAGHGNQVVDDNNFRKFTEVGQIYIS